MLARHDDIGERRIEPPDPIPFRSTGLPDELSVAMEKGDYAKDCADEIENALRCAEQLNRERRYLEAAAIIIRQVEAFDEAGRKAR